MRCTRRVQLLGHLVVERHERGRPGCGKAQLPEHGGDVGRDVQTLPAVRPLGCAHLTSSSSSAASVLVMSPHALTSRTAAARHSPFQELVPLLELADTSLQLLHLGRFRLPGNLASSCSLRSFTHRHSVLS